MNGTLKRIYNEDVPDTLGLNEFVKWINDDVHTAKKLGRHDGNVSLFETTLPEH